MIWEKYPNCKEKRIEAGAFCAIYNGLGLTEKQMAGAFRRMVRKRPKAMDWTNRSFFTEEIKTHYLNLVAQRYGQIGLATQN